MSKISATIVADSISPQGNRIVSILGVIPRIVLAELNTHRMFSRNSASSRAIPTHRMLKTVDEDPWIPIAWQKEHTGMQGYEYFTGEETISAFKFNHLLARDAAISRAQIHIGMEGSKQIANRYLEPFMWHTVLITATEFSNFFELRCPQYETEDGIFKSRKDALNASSTLKSRSNLEWLYINKGGAEIHISTFAECIWDAMNESKPKQLKAGEWHIPFEDKISKENLEFIESAGDGMAYSQAVNDLRIKVSTAMAARTSYTTVGDEKEISYERLIGIHDKLITQKPLHASPMEHCNRCMSEDELELYTKTTKEKGTEYGWCYNMRGFIPYRYILENK